MAFQTRGRPILPLDDEEEEPPYDEEEEPPYESTESFYSTNDSVEENKEEAIPESSFLKEQTCITEENLEDSSDTYGTQPESSDMFTVAYRFSSKGLVSFAHMMDASLAIKPPNENKPLTTLPKSPSSKVMFTSPLILSNSPSLESTFKILHPPQAPPPKPPYSSFDYANCVLPPPPPTKVYSHYESQQFSWYILSRTPSQFILNWIVSEFLYCGESEFQRYTNNLFSIVALHLFVKLPSSILECHELLRNYSRNISPPSLRTLSLFRMHTENEVKVSIAFSGAECNRILNNVSWGASDLVSFGAPNTIAIFSPKSAQILTTLPGHKIVVNCTYWLPTRLSCIISYMFNATVPSAVKRLARKYLRNPVVVTIGPAKKASDLISQHVIMMKESEKFYKLQRLLDELNDKTAIVFLNTEKSSNFLAKKFDKEGYHVTPLHEGKSQEQGEIISNLSKAAGPGTMIAAMRPNIYNIDEYVRHTTTRAFSVVASALVIPAFLPFLQAVFQSKKSWQARHTWIKIVQQIAILISSATLPHLRSLVEIIEHGLSVENQKVRTVTTLSLAALAEAAAPYDIENFDSVLKPLRKGIRQHHGKVLAAFLKEIGFIIHLMEALNASYYTKEVMLIFIREFQSPDEEMKKIILKVKQCVSIEGVETEYIRTDILPDFFRIIWVRRMALDRINYNQFMETTVEIANKVGLLSLMSSKHIDAILEHG